MSNLNATCNYGYKPKPKPNLNHKKDLYCKLLGGKFLQQLCDILVDNSEVYLNPASSGYVKTNILPNSVTFTCFFHR